MLIFSAVLSLGLVTCVCLAYRRDGFPIVLPLILAGVGAFCGFAVLFPTLFLCGILTIPGVLVWKWRGWSATSLAAFLVAMAMGIHAFLAYYTGAEHQRLRNQYAFESMEDRVPAPKSHAKKKVPIATERRLQDFERSVGENSNGFRTLMLERLHKESVDSFIDSPGFGVGRSIRRIRPTERTLMVNLDHQDDPLRQPDSLPSSTLSERDLKEMEGVESAPLREVHLSSVLDFVNPRGFGLVVSRKKVAGFQSHQFSMVPKAKQWKVRTVELVGLLINDEPVVYVSDNLPNMKTARTAPKRALNTFEIAGLAKLLDGEDLFLRETPHGIRMLGAVRSVEQCLKCHGGERGDLLGAFSYSLQREGR